MVPSDFIKIDVEGAELLVLYGSSRILNEIRPTIYIEVGTELSDKVTEIFHSKNYLLFNPDSTGKALKKCVFNTLAIPREKYS